MLVNDLLLLRVEFGQLGLVDYGRLFVLLGYHLRVINRLLLVYRIFFYDYILDLATGVSLRLIRLHALVQSVSIDRQTVQIVNIRQELHDMVDLGLFEEVDIQTLQVG